VGKVGFRRGSAAGRRCFQGAFGFFYGFLLFFSCDFPFDFFHPGRVVVLLVMVVVMTLDNFLDRPHLPGFADSFGLGAAPARTDRRSDGNTQGREESASRTDLLELRRHSDLFRLSGDSALRKPYAARQKFSV
jgi:hypothetical protein